MSKKSVLTLRVDTESKKRIVAVAHHEGMDITSFILKAAMKSVERAENRQKNNLFAQNDGMKVFRIICNTAQAGGEGGYYNVGFAIGFDLADGLKTLPSNVKTNDDMMAWFEHNHPQYILFVPRRRRIRFIMGVKDAFEQACLRASRHYPIAR